MVGNVFKQLESDNSLRSALLPRRLRLSEWARILGVSRVTIWSWTVRRGLTVSRIGRLSFIDERDLDVFMQHYRMKTLQSNIIPKHRNENRKCT